MTDEKNNVRKSGRPKIPQEQKKKYIGRIVIYVSDPQIIAKWKNISLKYRNNEACLASLLDKQEKRFEL